MEREVTCDRCREKKPVSQLEHEVDRGFGPGCTEHNYWCKDGCVVEAPTHDYTTCADPNVCDIHGLPT